MNTLLVHMTKQLLKVAEQVLEERLCILPVGIFAIFQQDQVKSWSTILFYCLRECNEKLALVNYFNLRNLFFNFFMTEVPCRANQ